jgi:hypothetical protein
VGHGERQITYAGLIAKMASDFLIATSGAKRLRNPPKFWRQVFSTKNAIPNKTMS